MKEAALHRRHRRVTCHFGKRGPDYSSARTITSGVKIYDGLFVTFNGFKIQTNRPRILDSGAPFSARLVRKFYFWSSSSLTMDTRGLFYLSVLDVFGPQ